MLLLEAKRSGQVPPPRHAAAIGVPSWSASFEWDAQFKPYAESRQKRQGVKSDDERESGFETKQLSDPDAGDDAARGSALQGSMCKAQNRTLPIIGRGCRNEREQDRGRSAKKQTPDKIKE